MRRSLGKGRNYKKDQETQHCNPYAQEHAIIKET